METVPAADPRWLALALDRLGGGGVVALPTDTVYGLAASLDLPAGIEAILRVKGRPLEKALPLLVPSLEGAEGLGFVLSEGALRLCRRFWPGPLTLVLPRSPRLPPWFAPGLPTTALRVPAHPVALELLRASRWLAVTSANRSGAPEALTAGEVAEAFPKETPLLVVDGGPVPGGRASTVVDATGAEPRLLREGPVRERDLWEVWHGLR